MKLGNMRKTEIWKFDIIEIDHGYWDEDKIIGAIEITFTNGIFINATFPFKGSYTKVQWDLLAQVSGKITEIEKQYEETP